MSKNPANKEGVFLSPPEQGLTVKSSIGITKVGNGTHPLTHGDSPLTPSTDRDNVGVSTRSPRGGPQRD